MSCIIIFPFTSLVCVNISSDMQCAFTHTWDEKKDKRMIIPKVKESHNFRKPINANRWTWKFNDNKMTFILSNRRWMTQFNIRLPKADQGERWKDTVHSYSSQFTVNRFCGSILSLVQILFSFDSKSLPYITIPKNKRK